MNLKIVLQVLDYTQYYLDLTASNRAAIPEWQPEYNLTQYYSLHDVSAYSLHNLAEKLRFGIPLEAAMFHKWVCKALLKNIYLDLQIHN